MTGAYDAVVIGGGFFGCSLALMLAHGSRRVLLLEREGDLLGRASSRNQARIHGGYHYPRSILTGLRSRVNCPRFQGDFPSCVDRSFKHYYAVARRQSHVTARQFELFCSRIEARLAPAPPGVRALFSPALIEQVYEVEELAFDAVKLREVLRERLRAAGVEVRLGVSAESVAPGLAVKLAGPGEIVRAPRVFNCTYARLNQLLDSSGLERIALRHELAELCLVQVPLPLRSAAVTVMCGPFFSLMPYPPLGLHSFSHVRYTPHCSWVEAAGTPPVPALPDRPTHFPQMQKDAQRYLPLLNQLRYQSSLFEVKTVLPQSDDNDSRPILFKPCAQLPGLVSVMGGKIDNVYDLPRELELLEAA